jgi:mono/diheme cytochrome c family protein
MQMIVCVAILLAGVVAIAPQTTAPPGNVQNGKRLFERDGCWQCHGWAGQGGRDGARLLDTALTVNQLTRYVRRPTGAMPAYVDKVLTDEELADIWAYLKSMPAPKPAKDIPLLNELKGP